MATGRLGAGPVHGSLPLPCRRSVNSVHRDTLGTSSSAGSTHGARGAFLFQPPSPIGGSVAGSTPATAAARPRTPDAASADVESATKRRRVDLANRTASSPRPQNLHHDIIQGSAGVDWSSPSEVVARWPTPEQERRDWCAGKVLAARQAEYLRWQRSQAQLAAVFAQQQEDLAEMLAQERGLSSNLPLPGGPDPFAPLPGTPPTLLAPASAPRAVGTDAALPPHIIRRSMDTPPSAEELRRIKAAFRPWTPAAAPTHTRSYPCRATRRHYRAAYHEFLQWAQPRGLTSHTLDSELDGLLARYLAKQLYVTGADDVAAMNVVVGTVFCRELPTLMKSDGSTVLPLCRIALTCFVQPGTSLAGEPCPLEAAALVAEWLLTRVQLRPRLAGLAFLCSYDLFTKPWEILTAQGRDVAVSCAGRYRTSLSVPLLKMIAGPDSPLFYDAERRPGAEGVDHDTVIAGIKKLGLEFVAEILELIKKRTHPTDHLFWPLHLGAYERLIRRAATAVGLDALHLTADSARLGGICSQAFMSLLSIGEVQDRGRWPAPLSFRLLPFLKTTPEVVFHAERLLRKEQSELIAIQLFQLTALQMGRGEQLLKGELATLALEAVKTLVPLRRMEVKK